MTALRPDEWQRVRELFEHAVTLPDAARRQFIADARLEEPLARRVASLLDAHLRAVQFLETSAMRSLAEERFIHDLTGTQLGPYAVEERIGAGGMGDVYRARDMRLDRIVAIKVLPAHTADDESARRRFDREARAVAALNHPCICTLYDVGAIQAEPSGAEVPFLVMEFLAGETLAEIVSRGPLAESEALAYTEQIATALRTAHDAGIVHRDLKPANIMVTAGGVKLLDFGLAKAPATPMSKTSPSPTVGGRDDTVSGAVLGTLCYMAPEQLRAEATDVRTDIYALGCVLYEMLTGTRLFANRTPTSAVQTTSPAVTHAAVAKDLEPIVARCVASDPLDRWQSVGDLLREIQRTLGSRAGTDPARLPFWGRQRPRMAAAAGICLLLGIGTWMYATRPPGAGAPTARLAVLPLRTIGTIAAGDEHLGVAVADSIITRLATVRRIELRPTTAVLRYADGETDPMQAADALGVDHVLTGTIQESPSTYRLTFQLAQTPGGAVTWARTYDVVRNALRDVQDSVAEQIVDTLRLQLGSDERDRLRRRYTERTDAYESYLKGRAALLNYTEAGMRDAIASFERALAIDPDYALARGGLAIATAWFSIRYAYETDALEWGARAESAARAALATDPTLAEARLAIAGAAGTMYGHFNWPIVLDQATAALAIDPTLELAHVVRMRAYFHFGQFDRMIAEAETAHRLNPLGNVEVARLEVAASLYSGQYGRARDQATALLARSDAPVIRNYLGLAQFYTGGTQQARVTLAAVERGGRPDVRSQAALASIEATAGDREAARARAERIAQGPYMDHHVAYSLAATWAQLGDTAAAIRWLKEAGESGFPCVPCIEVDPLLNPIRQQPEFLAVLAPMKQRIDRELGRLTPSR
jgi:serine/threonine-protein kinase